MLNFAAQESHKASQPSALILNIFDDLERDVLEAIKSMVPNVFSLGPLSLLCDMVVADVPLKSIRLNLWEEDMTCVEWLAGKEPMSVVYVNFGSITVMTAEQMVEFAWGLASSNHPFLWIIRPDLVMGDSGMLPPEFLRETGDGFVRKLVPARSSAGTPFCWRILDPLRMAFNAGDDL